MAEQTTAVQKIILDTNIIYLSANKSSAPGVLNYLQEFLSKGFGLAISDITGYEALRGVNSNKLKERSDLLSIFTNYELDKGVLASAARLDDIYLKAGIQPKQIEVCDKFIAATCILTGNYVLTTNPRDFPLPFFREIERKYIDFLGADNRKSTAVIVLLLVDSLVLKKALDNNELNNAS